MIDALSHAVMLAADNVAAGGGPFGAVIVRGDEIIATGTNQVTPTLDPTAHAEIVAIRAACQALGRRLPVAQLSTEDRNLPFSAWLARTDRVHY